MDPRLDLRRATAAVRAAAVLAGAAAPRRGALVLAYHDVRPDAGAAEPWTVTPSAFARHLDALASAGLEVVPLEHLVERLAAGGPDGLAAITFDDALAGVYADALPLLAERGLPATVFAVARGLGESPPQWWPEARRTMTEAELREALAAGMALGSHTRTHPSLPALDESRLADELAGAKADLEDGFGVPVPIIAYPFGHHDARVRRAASAAGHAAGLTFLNGRAHAGIDLFRIPRLTMGPHHGRLRLAYHFTRTPEAWPDTQLDRVD